MKQRLKNLFVLSNWKRFLISAITIVSTFIVIVLGSVFYISKDVNKSIDYGGGIEVLVQVKKDDQNADKTLTEQVNKSLFDRLTGGTGLNGITISSEGDGKIRITKAGNVTNAQRDIFEKEISEKPILTVTDINLKPLFFDGSFTANGSLDRGTPQNWVPPFALGAAKYVNQNGRDSVQLTLKNSDARLEWTKATDYLSKQSQPNNLVLMWLDIDKLLHIAKTQYPLEWKESGENLWNFVHVNNQAYTQIQDPVTNQPRLVANEFKKNVLDIQNKYLISVAQVNNPISTSEVIINGNFTNTQAQELANRINFGLSDYSIDILSSVFLSSNLNDNAFQSAIIAGIVIFSLISIFMIVNYGLLGVLTTISIALYIYLTLLMFTVLRGEYSPVTIAALIIGIGISVDANVITYERLKKYVYSGDSLKKAFYSSNRLSLSSILDANITTIIIAFILFYFGTKDVRGYSITLTLSILFTLLVMLVFSRFLSYMLVNTGLFEKRLYLLGLHKKYINHKTKLAKINENFNYYKNAKWFVLASLSFMVISLIVFASISGANKDIWAGLNRNIEFTGGINLNIATDRNTANTLSLAEANEIKKQIVESSQTFNIENVNSIIDIQKANEQGTNYVINIRSQQDLSSIVNDIKNIATRVNPFINVATFTVSSSEAAKLVQNAILATGIGFVGIVLYLLFRMNWTYSIAAIIALIHDFLMVLAFVVITRLQVSTIIVAAMLSIIGLSINDTVVTFDRIREKIKFDYTGKILQKSDLKKIVNVAIADTIKRSIYTSFTTILAVSVILAFGNAINFTFNIVMLFGIAIGVYSSVFIASWVWAKLEYIRQKGIVKRKEKGFWEINNPEEQTVNGINDFNY